MSLLRRAAWILALVLVAVGLVPHRAAAQTTPAPIATGDWPMDAQNLQGTGQSPFGTFNASGTLQLPPPIRRPVLGDNGVLYVTTSNAVEALDLATGGILGSLPLNGDDGPAMQSSAAPALVDGTLYIAGVSLFQTLRFAAVNTATMDTLWTADTSLRGGLTSTPSVASNGVAYVHESNVETLSRLIAVDLDDERVAWTVVLPQSSATPTPPVIAPDGRVLVSVGSAIYAVTPSLEQPLVVPFFEANEGSRLTRPALSADGQTAYVLQVGFTGNTLFAQLIALDVDTGTVLWTFTEEDVTGAIPPVVGADGNIYVSGSDVDGNYLASFSPDGVERWVAPLRGVVPEAIAARDDGTIYMTIATSQTFEHGVQVFNPDGTERWVSLNQTEAAALTQPPSLNGAGTAFLPFEFGVRAVVGPRASAPTSVLFGVAAVGDTNSRVITVSNVGDAPLALTEVRLASGAEFAIVEGGTPGDVEPGASRSIQVTFTPSAGTSFTDELTVETNVGETVIALSGTGLQGVIEAPEEIAFGDVPVGEPAPEQDLVITNTGTATVTIAAVELVSGVEFSIVSDSGESELPPTASRVVRVGFTPSGEGDVEGQIAITSDVGETTVILTGTGVLGTIGAPEEVAFGSIAIGQAAPERSLTITNTGAADIVISEIALRDSLYFGIVSDTGPPVLAPDASRVVRLGFTPPAEGVFEDVLTITTDVGATDVVLTGRGVQVEGEEFEGVVGEPATVSFDLPEGFAPEFRELCYRTGGTAAYSCVEMSLGTGTVEAQLPVEVMTERGVQFFARLIETREEGSVEVTFPSSSPEANPAEVRVQFQTFPAEGAFPAEGYRMVSVPGELSNADVESVLFDEYGAYDIEAWRLLRWNAAAEAYDEFPDLSTDLQPGLAYWLITRDGEFFDAGAGRSTALDPVTLTLPPGWSQIGTPFAFPVSWSSVDGAESLPLPFFFDGEGFVPNQPVLTPWEGYFVENPTGEPVTITIPPIEANATGEVPTEAAARIVTSTASGAYTLRILATLDDVRDPHTYLGLRPGARDGRDVFDFGDPPPVSDHVQVSIVEDGARLAGSFRPTGTDGQAWSLDVSARRDGRGATGPVHLFLRPEGTLPDGHTLYVVDDDADEVLPVVDGRVTVGLTDASTPRRLRVVAGTEAFARKATEGVALTPDRFALRPIYPNPVRAEATIPFDLPASMRVSVQVFDVLGRRVHTLLDAGRSAGTHAVRWDGRSASGRPVASGIYFLRVTAGPHTATQKVVVVR